MCVCVCVCVCGRVHVCVRMHAYEHQNGPHLQITSVDRNESHCENHFVCVLDNKLRMQKMTKADS